MSDWDGLRGCDKCGNYTTGRLCTSCAHQEMIDNYDGDYDYEQPDQEALESAERAVLEGGYGGDARDWREMEAGPELDRLIAERLGVRVVADYFPVSGRTGYGLIDRDGGLLGGLLNGENYWDAEEPWMSCPPFSTDLNAAMLLAIGEDYSLAVIAKGNAVLARISGDSVTEAFRTPLPWQRGHRHNAALQVCRAWLAWDDARKVQEG